MTTNIPNNPAVISAMTAAIKSDGKATAAHSAFYATCETLAKLLVVADDLKHGGRYYNTAYDLIVDLRLTAQERNVLASAEPMVAGTEKHKIANRVGSMLRNIRDNLKKIEGGATKGKGKNATIASFADLCAKELQMLHNRAEKDDADHGEFQVALIRAADLIGLAWSNGKFAAKKK
jgi:hypothetical protein